MHEDDVKNQQLNSYRQWSVNDTHCLLVFFKSEILWSREDLGLDDTPLTPEISIEFEVVAILGKISPGS